MRTQEELIAEEGLPVLKAQNPRDVRHCVRDARDKPSTAEDKGQLL